MFKVIIAGGRDFNDYKLLHSKCSSILNNYLPSEVEVVSGGAKGADLLGEMFAREKGITTKCFLPDWDFYGKKAGMLRNKEMAFYADALIAFWDGKSKGTKNMIDEAKKKGLKIRVIYYT
jgi:hypothetical protein